LIKKGEKIKALKEMLKTCFIPLRGNNSLITQTNLPETLHYAGFLNVTAFAGSRRGGAFLLMPDSIMFTEHMSVCNCHY
jgi:hypothetical protein